MKISLVSIVVIFCIAIIINFNNNGVDAAYDISIDRSKYIRNQLQSRSKSVNDQISKLASEVNNVFGDKYGGLFFGLTTYMNTLSGLFGMLNLAIPCGGAGILSSAVLGVAQNAVSGTGGDIGSTIANGVKKLIDESISEYNMKTLDAYINSEKKIVQEYYTDDIYTNESLIKAKAVHSTFYLDTSHFTKSGYELETICLFTLHANSHLLFLYDIVVNGERLYRIPSQDINYFVTNFYQYLNDYRDYINRVNTLGINYLNQRISNGGIKHQDEWNLRNDYYNFMKIFVYDISNYWDYLRPDLFPKGMFIENAHVSLSSIFGAPFKGDYHMISSDIQAFIDSKNPYQYQGQFKGFYYKNLKCKGYERVFNLVKYFGGRQYFFREGVTRDTFFLGDEGSDSGDRQYADFTSIPMQSVYQYNSRDGSPKHSRDYYWGLGVSNSSTQYNVGNIEYSNSKTLISFPDKTAATVLPLSYNKCVTNCHGSLVYRTRYIVEAAVVGFVNSDVKDTNTVFELTGTMIDAQKYNYITSNNGVYYSRDGYRQYKHSMFFPANTRITYKVYYNPYNGLSSKFKFYIDFKTSVTNTLNVKVYSSSSPTENIQLAVQTNVNVVSTGQLAYIGDVTLNPTTRSTNFISVQFSHPVFLNHISFYSTE